MVSKRKVWLVAGTLCLLAVLAVQVGIAAKPPVDVLHVPDAGAPAPPGTDPGGSSAAQTVVEDGFVCTVIDFEGVGNLNAIPVFDGISSPGWLGIIDADAGGTGNFAFEPSPQTIAFWLGGAPGARDITFDSPVSKVGFFYASYVTVILRAFDQSGALVDWAWGPPNFNQGPGGDPTGYFNKWDPLEVEADENVITRVQVSGNVNQTGIDDLKVCRALRIASVEPTQAIQEYQEIDDLKTDLQPDGEPPVPIVEGKPMALRVYVQQVQAVTTVEVELDIPGVTNQSRTVTLQPHCTPELRRARDRGCLSMDFTFVPPSGSWTATLHLKDDAGNEVEEHELPFTSRDADTLALRAVAVCDARVPDWPIIGIWQCSSANDLVAMADFLRRTAPTDSVTVTVTNNRVRRRTIAYDADGDGVVSAIEMRPWWVDSASDVANNFGFFDIVAGLFGEQRYYYGMVRPGVPGGIGGIANGIPSRGAASRTSAIRLGVETNREVVAHETGHMLGRRHTNTGLPPAAGAPPGCYSTAQDAGTGWPFANNRIQSVARLEVGFDVSANQPVDPQNNYDWMSYCTPRWISPFTYNNAMTALNATFALEAAAPDLGASVFGPFWTVGGILNGAGAGLRPIFTLETEASTDAGTGSHRVEVRDAAGTALFTRFFTPDEPHAESEDGSDVSGVFVFYELLPVQAGTSRIVVLDGTGTELLGVTLGGTAPSVTISSPASGEVFNATHLLEWSFSDPDSSDHWSWVEYSSDQGETWASLGVFPNETALVEDFATLPGASGTALIRVRVSDGVNTGTAVSGAFSVGTKAPTAEILFPDSGRIFRSGDLVWLRANAYDVDDGVLDEGAVAWESSLEGFLGNGASLPVGGLSQGHHEITLTATDSDGNSASASTAIVVAGGPPSLDLEVVALDQLPTTCVRVSIDAEAAPQSVDLETVEYSLDGGESWTPVALPDLPLSFIVPGDGFFHVVARAFDEAGQADVADSRVFVDSPCEIAGDVTPPTIESLTASPDVLWPPNHKMVDVAIDVVVTDDTDPSPVCEVVGVTSSEPVTGTGDVTSPDWEVTGALAVDLRAERTGRGDGRVYTVEVECSDASGNTASATVDVVVPHDQRKK